MEVREMLAACVPGCQELLHMQRTNKSAKGSTAVEKHLGVHTLYVLTASVCRQNLSLDSHTMLLLYRLRLLLSGPLWSCHHLPVARQHTQRHILNPVIQVERRVWFRSRTGSTCRLTGPIQGSRRHAPNLQHSPSPGVLCINSVTTFQVQQALR